VFVSVGVRVVSSKEFKSNYDRVVYLKEFESNGDQRFFFIKDFDFILYDLEDEVGDYLHFLNFQEDIEEKSYLQFMDLYCDICDSVYMNDLGFYVGEEDGLLFTYISFEKRV
jgi:hypothetical protein